NSVFLKNGRVYKNNGTAQWGWDFFGANGEGMVWSSTASEAMGPSTPAIVVSPSGGGFNGWAARGTALQIQCGDAMNAAYSVWKAVQPGRAWIAGLDLYMPSNNVGLVMLHVNDSNFQFSGVGDFSIPGSVYCTSVVQTSDETKKSDIEVIENSDDIVSSWSGKTFTLNFNDRKSAGVIAQEIMEKFPVAVTILPDGSLAVDYSTLIAPMIESMKNRISNEAKLLKRIEDLEKKFVELGK
ncbi:tail fiber domain-containing protein, partial [Limnobaculum sp. M2-1]